MNKIKEAQKILKDLGFPSAQQNEMSALTLLALAGLNKGGSWRKVKRRSLTITKGIMRFVTESYGKEYAPNTRETFRRQVLHQFVQAGIVDYNPDNPNLPTNSPRVHYALTQEVVSLLKKYRTKDWKRSVKSFVKKLGSLKAKYKKQRERRMIPVRVRKGLTLNLSPGKHNKLQSEVVEEFIPRFTPGAQLLYLGDTARKNLFVDKNSLKEVGIPITKHDKLPDLVLWEKKRNCLYLIEVVTSHGPINPKRIVELNKIISSKNLQRAYITAFPDFNMYKKHLKDIAWETEVWVAEEPEHMIHHDGERFVSLKSA